MYLKIKQNKAETVLFSNIRMQKKSVMMSPKSKLAIDGGEKAKSTALPKGYV